MNVHKILVLLTIVPNATESRLSRQTKAGVFRSWIAYSTEWQFAYINESLSLALIISWGFYLVSL